MEIVLVEPVRCFQPAHPQSLLLGKTYRSLPKGARIEVDDPVKMSYDHRDQLAVPYRYRDESGFLLYSEVGRSIELALTRN